MLDSKETVARPITVNKMRWKGHFLKRYDNEMLKKGLDFKRRGETQTI